MADRSRMAATGIIGGLVFVITAIAWVTIYFGFMPSISDQEALSAKLDFSLNLHKNCVHIQTSLQEDFDEAKRAKSTLNDIIQRLKTDIDNLNSKLRVKDESLEYLKKELKASQTGLKICSKQLDKANSLVVNFTKRVSHLEKEREVYGNELSQRRRDVEQLLNELDEMHVKFSNMTEILNESIEDVSTTLLPEDTPESTKEMNLTLSQDSAANRVTNDLHEDPRHNSTAEVPKS